MKSFFRVSSISVGEEFLDDEICMIDQKCPEPKKA
jgi:hypothetical protein